MCIRDRLCCGSRSLLTLLFTSPRETAKQNRCRICISFNCFVSTDRSTIKLVNVAVSSNVGQYGSLFYSIQRTLWYFSTGKKRLRKEKNSRERALTVVNLSGSRRLSHFLFSHPISVYFSLFPLIFSMIVSVWK